VSNWSANTYGFRVHMWDGVKQNEPKN